MASPEDFKPLHYQSRVFEGALQNRYRVYRDKANFIVVEATNAAEAFRLSAIESPYQIIRESVLMGQNVLSGDLLTTPEARTALQNQQREQEAALAVASARREAMQEGQIADLPEKNISRSSPMAEINENPNLMPDASGALPSLEPMPEITLETPSVQIAPEKSAGSLKESQELDQEDVRRLLGESS